jgi:hypothetical protein
MNPGEKRGRWTMIRECEQPKFLRGSRRFAIFRCDCGREKPVAINEVVIGNSRSCGCVGRAAWRRDIKANVIEVAANARARRGK